MPRLPGIVIEEREGDDQARDRLIGRLHPELAQIAAAPGDELQKRLTQRLELLRRAMENKPRETIMALLTPRG